MDIGKECVLYDDKICDGCGESFEERFKRLKLFIPFEKINEYERLRQNAVEISRGYNEVRRISFLTLRQPRLFFL